MDIAAVSSALSSIKTATDIAKLIRESTNTLEKAELNLKMAEVISSLADAKIQIADIKQSLLEREESIAILQREKQIRANLQYDQPYYWLLNGEAKEGPYCQKCYDVDGKLIRLQGSTVSRGWWQCHSCSCTFHDKNYNWSSDSYSSSWSGA